jgi:hypothetical protein
VKSASNIVEAGWIQPQSPDHIPATQKQYSTFFQNPVLHSVSAVMLFILNLRLSILAIGWVSNALALVAPRAVVDCPPNRLEIDRKCIPYVENKDIAGISFSLYTWTDPKAPTSHAADPKYLKPLQNAVAKVLPSMQTA